MNSFAVPELKPETYFTSDLVIDKNFVLCSKYCSLSDSVLKALRDWGFTQVQSEGNIGIAVSSEAAALAAQEQKYQDISIEQAMSDAANEAPPSVESGANKAIKQAIAKAQANDASTANTDKSRLEVVQSVYNEYLNYISSVYTHYATHKQLNLDEISETVKELCVYIKENRRYVLRITPSLEARNKNFLVSHSMRSTVLAITIGLQLRMPLSKLVELGVASILHEIGMIRLPPQLYMTDKPLTAAEKAQISTHPIIAYNILKDANFPLSIQLGVLEHHERETGTGYPRHIPGPKISLYAKIIAVACSFEAITAPRHYKEARTTYEGMIEMLKNENHQYDDTVVKALLYSLSLYPIGAYVYLSNGKVAQVTDVNPGNPKNPIVQIVGETEKDGSPKAAQTNDTNLKIVRVMNKQEASDVLNALNAQKAKR
jgi:HD-GYP domain-containing protein (c-di-GMP phosphodiesterase class II)